MKTLLLVTYVDFWKKGSGHRTRINSIVNYLQEKVNITVFFAGAKEEMEEDFLKDLYPEVDFQFATLSGYITYKECQQIFASFIKDKFFDFALIEYIELAIVLEYLPDSTVTLLDTHDLIHKRIISFAKYKIYWDGIILNKKEELNLFKCFDYVILIQKTDYEYISAYMDDKRLLLAPHPVVLQKKIPRRKITNVGYIASSYQPNIDALNWFITKVWYKLETEMDLKLNVYGPINIAFSAIKKPNIIFHGVVDNLEEAYNNIDLIINPIRCGAGLKIKNVEALGHGIPLITTSHGALGMEDGVSKAFLVANTAKQFLSALDDLSKNFIARQKLSNNGFNYAINNFAEEKCYHSLLTILNAD